MGRSKRRASRSLRYEARKLLRSWFAKAVLAVIFFAGVYIIITSIHIHTEGVASSDWPFVNGQVVSVEIGQSKSRRSRKNRTRKSHARVKTYRAEVVYRFEVDNKPYEGTRIGVADSYNSDRDVAEAQLRKYPKGAAVRVFYSPSNPEQSMLAPGPRKNSLFQLITGFFVGTVMAVGAAAILWFAIRDWRRDQPHGVKAEKS